MEIHQTNEQKMYTEVNELNCRKPEKGKRIDSWVKEMIVKLKKDNMALTSLQVRDKLISMNICSKEDAPHITTIHRLFNLNSLVRKKITPKVLAKIFEYKRHNPKLSRGKIRMKLISEGFCTKENAPALSTISRKLARIEEGKILPDKIQGYDDVDMNISVNDFAPDCVDDFATDWQCDQYVYAGESGGGGGQPNLCENPGETSDEQGVNIKRDQKVKEADGELEDIHAEGARKMKTDGKESRPTKKRASYPYGRVKCARCPKILVRKKDNFKKHYIARHGKIDSVAIAEINETLKKRNLESKVSKSKRAKECLFCNKVYSYAALYRYHLRLKAEKRCSFITLNDSEKSEVLESEILRNNWTIKKIARCRDAREKPLALPPVTEELSIFDKYTEESVFTAQTLANVSYHFNLTRQGAFPVSTDIRKKIEENRPMTALDKDALARANMVRGHQKKVLASFFGSNAFTLGQLDCLNDWMLTTKSEDDFRTYYKKGKKCQYSLSYMCTMTRSVVLLIQYLIRNTKDQSTKAKLLVTKGALASLSQNFRKDVSNERAWNNAHQDVKNQIVDLAIFKKFFDCDKIQQIMKRALSQGLHGNKIEVYQQKEISALKSIAAILLTLNSGKRSGALCAIRVSDVFNAKCLERKVCGRRVFEMKIKPHRELSKLKVKFSSTIQVLEGMYAFLKALAEIETAATYSPGSCLLSTATNIKCRSIMYHFRNAWKVAEIDQKEIPHNLTSSNMRRTILTLIRRVSSLSQEEKLMLHDYMEHSEKTADSIYLVCNEPLIGIRKAEIDETATAPIEYIKNVMKLNDWDDELVIANLLGIKKGNKPLITDDQYEKAVGIIGV